MQKNQVVHFALEYHMEQGREYGVYLFGLGRIKRFVEKNTARTAEIYASGDEGNAPDKEPGEKPCANSERPD